MKTLKDLSHNEIKDMFKNKINTTIEIPLAIARFKVEIPNVDFSVAREIPPTPMILTPDGIAQVVVHGSNDLEGKFLQLVVFVYASSGKIFYTELKNGNYKAEIKWYNVS